MGTGVGGMVFDLLSFLLCKKLSKTNFSTLRLKKMIKSKKLSKTNFSTLRLKKMIINMYADPNPCGAARFSGPRYVVAALKSS